LTVKDFWKICGTPISALTQLLCTAVADCSQIIFWQHRVNEKEYWNCVVKLLLFEADCHLQGPMDNVNREQKGAGGDPPHIRSVESKRKEPESKKK